MVVAPTTSNSTTKIALGIGNTLITNAVNMAVKANVPVYVYPCEVGETDGQDMAWESPFLHRDSKKLFQNDFSYQGYVGSKK